MQVKLLTEAEDGLRGQDICVITYYSRQVQRLRNYLRNQQLGQVSSHTASRVVADECCVRCKFTGWTMCKARSSELSSSQLYGHQLQSQILRKKQDFLLTPRYLSLAPLASPCSNW